MRLVTVDELLDALGGTGAVADLLGIGASTVSNWRAAGEIPVGWHMRLYAECINRQLDVDTKALFGVTIQAPFAVDERPLERMSA